MSAMPGRPVTSTWRSARTRRSARSPARARAWAITSPRSSARATAASSSSNSGPLSLSACWPPGTVVDCTITNKRKPRVKVTKDLPRPGADPGKFNLQINGVTSPEDGRDQRRVDPLRERGGGIQPDGGRSPPGRAPILDNYEVLDRLHGREHRDRLERRPVAGRHAERPGQTVDCTITNKRKPRVNVTKDLIPGTDSGKFNLQVNGVTKKTRRHRRRVDRLRQRRRRVGPHGRRARRAPAPIWPTTSPRSPAPATAPFPRRTRVRCRWATCPQGAVVDCTITNKRKPRVTVTKDLAPG